MRMTAYGVSCGRSTQDVAGMRPILKAVQPAVSRTMTGSDCAVPKPHPSVGDIVG
jgi:hypothetical protein